MHLYNSLKLLADLLVHSIPKQCMVQHFLMFQAGQLQQSQLRHFPSPQYTVQTFLAALKHSWRPLKDISPLSPPLFLTLLSAPFPPQVRHLCQHQCCWCMKPSVTATLHGFPSTSLFFPSWFLPDHLTDRFVCFASEANSFRERWLRGRDRETHILVPLCD